MQLKDFIKKDKNTLFKDLTKKEVKHILKFDDLKSRVIEVLKYIYDPEISVNIWDLGLVYKVDINKDINLINIEMTLTSYNCPVADYITLEVKKKVKKIIGNDMIVNVNLVWDPIWDKSKMTEEARFILDI